MTSTSNVEEEPDQIPRVSDNFIGFFAKIGLSRPTSKRSQCREEGSEEATT